MSVRRELASGVFYTSIAKYAGIVVTLVASLTLKGTAALGVWLLYVHLSGEYDLKGLAGRLLARKKR